MSIVRMISPYVAAALTSRELQLWRREFAQVQRWLRREPHRVSYFHQVDDPYSQLAAQVLEELHARYDIEVVPYLVGPPRDDAAPERQRLHDFAKRDAADISQRYGLEFPSQPVDPTAEQVRRAQRMLLGDGAFDFVTRAPKVGLALWLGDESALQELEQTYGVGSDAAVDAALAKGNAMRQHLGHYSSAMFWYGDEWYWGVDRLHYLEERLTRLGTRREAPHDDATPIVPIPRAGVERHERPPQSPVTVEFYASLRSPYTHIAMERVLSLPRRYPVHLELRPVLPMVMRGLPVPYEKRMYIMLDTKREADRVGVDFGFVCDPVGKPVEMGFSLWRWARDKGRGGEYLHAFTRAAFAEGIDCGTEAGLRHVVERAGLDWSEAQSHREADAWRTELETNRETMFNLGLWGVPSFRVRGGDRPDFNTWGQDRLWRVEEEIVARLA